MSLVRQREPDNRRNPAPEFRENRNHMSTEKVGNLARQMAATQPSPKAEPKAETPNTGNTTAEPTNNEPKNDHPLATITNRMDRLFYAINFVPSDSGRVYTDDRSGVKSRRAALVFAELRDPLSLIGSGIIVRGTIYARKSPAQTKPVAEFSFAGSTGQPAITVQPDNHGAKADVDAWRIAIRKSYQVWLKANPSAAAASSGDEVVELDGFEL